jgi:hypothetical protein
MRLVQVLSILLTQLSVGSLLMTSLLPTREIRLSFFTFNSLFCAIVAALALVFSKWLLAWAWLDVRFLGLTVIGATVAYGCFRLEKPQLGRLFLILSGILGLLFGLLPLWHKMLVARGIDTPAAWLFDASVLAGALLLGATHIGMVLGHWYLLMRRLSFAYLQRFSQLLLGTVALRLVLLLISFPILRQQDPAFADAFLPALLAPSGHLFFFVMRVLWGLLLPAVLSVLVLRCVQAKANQAATGMLYVVEISVLFGELFAAYLLI